MPSRTFSLLRAMLATLAIAFPAAVRADAAAGAGEQWPVWGGDAGASHFSRLTDITPQNVASLEVAWTHQSGDFADGSGSTRPTSFESVPLAVNGHLYYCTPFQRVFALDPETGKEVWHFDPVLKEKKGEGPYPLNCRGISYWEDSAASAGQACAKRLFYGTADAELISIDADTGKPCEGFGEGGRVNLRKDMGKVRTWGYYPTSPRMVMRDRVVINGFVADNLEVNSPPGVVRAFDARTGKQVWSFHTVPRDGEPGVETWGKQSHTRTEIGRAHV